MAVKGGPTGRSRILDILIWPQDLGQLYSIFVEKGESAPNAIFPFNFSDGASHSFE